MLRILSESLTEKIELNVHFRQAHTVLLFHSLPDEPDMGSLLKRWWKKKILLLPVVVGENLILRRYRGEESLGKGAFGIMEPMEVVEEKSFSIPDLAIVPGVAFDNEGHRLGRGKGYYDRLLSQALYDNTYKIGCCFRFQLVDEVPTASHDVKMDEVLSS